MISAKMSERNTLSACGLIEKYVRMKLRFG